MIKKIASCVLVLFLSSCDYKPSQTNQFKWAVVDKNKIETTVFDTFKKNYPYPPGLTGDAESRQKLNSTYEKINQIKEEKSNKCISSIKVSDKQSKSKSHEKDPVSEDDLYMMGPDGRPMRVRNSVPETSGLVWRKDYNECIRKIEVDPEVAALGLDVARLKSSELERYKFDGETKKKLKEAIEKTVAEYAYKNDYQLVITTYQDNIVYNSGKVVLNITDAIIDAIQTPQTDSKIKKEP